MKKSYKFSIGLAIVFIVLRANAQVYFPEAGYWDQKYHSIAWGHGGEVIWDITTYSTFAVQGDTLVNDTLFYRVLKNNVFAYYFCEIGQKVYFGSVTNDLRLIYDYSLQVGETFQFYAPSYSGWPNDLVRTVSAIDSVFIGGTWRKRITFNNFPGYGPGPKWIQGIGDVNFGGLETDYSYISWYANTKTLLCFYDFGTPLFGLCTTGQAEKEAIQLIYPNPCSNSLFIETPSYKLPADLSMYSIQGNLVMKKTILNENEILNLENCNPGLYILYLNNHDEMVSRKILILDD
jgi:hypothetical protein